MRRREFIALVSGTVLAARVAAAQQPAQVRRVGVLMGLLEDDPEAQPRMIAFRIGLEEAGWIEGRSVQTYYRWAGADPDRMRKFTKDLIEFRPDVILGHNTRPVATLLRETRTIPIVFVAVADPVGSGFVASVSRPGGNITGFTNHEPSLASKWLDLLKDFVPRITRVALLFNPQTAPQAGSFFSGPFEAAAPHFAIEPIALPVHSPAEIEPAMATLARENTGLVVMADTFTTLHRDLIVGLAAKHRIPAIYPWPFFATVGGLVAYGPDQVDMFRRAASYVDRILRGANPAELPVQAPTKFELVINLKTAQMLGLDAPATLIAQADKVIE